MAAQHGAQDGSRNGAQDGSRTTLVLGGTGKTGRRVAARLTARGLPVRVGSRAGEPPFDWEDQATWAPALRDVASVYVSYYPDLAAPGAPEAIRSFAELAVSSGVPRLVLLSGRGEEEAQHSEELLKASGTDWTIVRASWFMQNFSEDFLLGPVRAGEIMLPAADVPEPFVSVEDIADVAAAALTEDGHVGELYEVTGPRLLTFTEVAAEITKAVGWEIRFVRVSLDEFAAGMAQQGTPRELVEFLLYLFANVLDGRNAHLTDGVQRVLGRQPGDFSDFARAAAATGVWSG